MIIQNIDQFLDYHGKVKSRTRRLISCIPEDHLEWTFKPGKFTIGDQVRHIANIERYMYGETVQFKESSYSGCGVQFASGLQNVINYYDAMHEETHQILQQVDNDTLHMKCTTPGKVQITMWKWLRSMLEHEIHHRAQIYLYLSILEVKTPPIFGLTAEEVEAARRRQ